jgi:hypothetical protein
LFENIYTDIGWDLTPLDYSAVAKHLHGAGVLRPDGLVASAHDGKERSSTAAALQDLQKVVLTQGEWKALDDKGQSLADALHLDLVTELSTLFSGLTFKPLVLRHGTVHLEAVPHSIERELLVLYAKLASDLRAKHAHGVMRGYPHRLFIPPIAALLLADAKRPERIPHLILEYRDKFAPLRHHLRELQAAVSSDTASMVDVERVETAMTQLSIRLSPDAVPPEIARVAFLRNFGGFLIKSLLKMGLDYESLFKLLSTDAAEWLANRHKTRSAMVLLDIVQKYKSMKQYGTLIERVFGHELQADEIHALEHSINLRRVKADVDVDALTEGWAFFQLR